MQSLLKLGKGWELAFLSLGMLYIDCRAKSLLKMVLEKQRSLLVLPLLKENKQHCSHLEKVFCLVVIQRKEAGQSASVSHS